MQKSRENANDIDDVITSLILFNAKLRNEIISTYPSTARCLITDELLNHIATFLCDSTMTSTEKLDIILDEHPNIFDYLFSKGYDRLATFRTFLKKGIISCPFSAVAHKSWTKFTKAQQGCYAAVVLVVAQVFGDGNHRTSGELVKFIFPRITQHQLIEFWNLTEFIHRSTGSCYPHSSDCADKWTDSIINISDSLFNKIKSIGL